MANTTSPGTEDDLKNYQGPEGIVNRWLKELAIVQESRQQRAFETIGERINKKYRNASEVDEYSSSTSNVGKKTVFNVLWSNLQVLKPALYSRMPKVVGERVFKDRDPIGRLAAEGAERATHYMLLSQQDRFNYAVKAAVQDRLLPGRGQVWLEYETEFQDAMDENGEPMLDDAGEAVRTPKPNSERVKISPVNWLDYLESPARNQYEVRWRAIRLHQTRAELVKNFGAEIGNAVELGEVTGGKKKKEDDVEFLRQAELWVIYDITSKEVLWISKGYRAGPLKQLHDPLRLKDFWCCPLPLVATTTTDSTYPTADYAIYEGLAEEYNFVTKRLKAIIECVKLVGAVSASFAKDVKKITALADGQCWPIENWAAFADKQGFKGVIDWLPFDQCTAAIPQLMGYQQSLKAQLDEITSMPDIVQGSSDPNDPVYTQQQKSHWTVIKLVEKQQEVQRFCREIVSKMAEIIFEPGLFSDETITLMAGVAQMSPEKQQMWPQALQLLRDDRLRTFRIDIETDSTIAIDEDEQIARWQQYLSSVKDIVGEVESISQYRPELFEPIVESALSAVRVLRTGRSVEGAWEKAFDDIQANDKAKAEQAAQQPPPPDYEMMKAQTDQARAQTEQMKAQTAMTGAQFDQWEKQQRLMLDKEKIEGDLQIRNDTNQIANEANMSRAQIDQLTASMEMFQQQFESKIEQQKLALQAVDQAHLAREDHIAALKMVSDHVTSLAEARNSKESASTPAAPPVHVNTGTVHITPPAEPAKATRRIVKVRRNPTDNSLEGESIDVPHEVTQ